MFSTYFNLSSADFFFFKISDSFSVMYKWDVLIPNICYIHIYSAPNETCYYIWKMCAISRFVQCCSLSYALFNGQWHSVSNSAANDANYRYRQRCFWFHFYMTVGLNHMLVLFPWILQEPIHATFGKDSQKMILRKLYCLFFFFCLLSLVSSTKK